MVKNTISKKKKERAICVAKSLEKKRSSYTKTEKL